MWGRTFQKKCMWNLWKNVHILHSGKILKKKNVCRNLLGEIVLAMHIGELKEKLISIFIKMLMKSHMEFNQIGMKLDWIKCDFKKTSVSMCAARLERVNILLINQRLLPSTLYCKCKL